MKIGIIGTGNMGRTLGMIWTERGHEVFFGARDAEEAQMAASHAGRDAHFGTNDEAALFGDVIFYTLRNVAPVDVIKDISSLEGKIIVDPNNGPIPEDFGYPPIEVSLAEKLQAHIPKAHVVKAFNTIAQEVFELSPDPLRKYCVSVFIASDDGGARQTVMSLAEDLGFSPLDCGPLRNSRMIEGLAHFIRYVRVEKKQPYAKIYVNVLPAEKSERLGGREPSQLS